MCDRNNGNAIWIVLEMYGLNSNFLNRNIILFNEREVHLKVC